MTALSTVAGAWSAGKATTPAADAALLVTIERGHAANVAA